MPLSEEEKRAISSWAAAQIKALDQAFVDDQIFDQLQADLRKALDEKSLILSENAEKEAILAFLRKELENYLRDRDKMPIFSIRSKEESKEAAPQEMFAIRTKGKTDKIALDYLKALFNSPPSEHYLEDHGITVHPEKPTKPYVQKFNVTNSSGISYKVSAVQESDGLSYRTNLTGSESDQQEAIDRICRIAVDAAPKDHIFDLSETPEDKKIMMLSGLTRALERQGKTEEEIENLIPESVNYRSLRFSS